MAFLVPHGDEFLAGAAPPARIADAERSRRDRPPPAPAHLLTVTEYAELGETESGYTDLVEGRLLVSPSPVPDRNYAASELLVQP